MNYQNRFTSASVTEPRMEDNLMPREDARLALLDLEILYEKNHISKEEYEHRKTKLEQIIYK